MGAQTRPGSDTDDHSSSRLRRFSRSSPRTSRRRPQSPMFPGPPRGNVARERTPSLRRPGSSSPSRSIWSSGSAWRNLPTAIWQRRVATLAPGSTHPDPWRSQGRGPTPTATLAPSAATLGPSTATHLRFKTNRNPNATNPTGQQAKHASVTANQFSVAISPPTSSNPPSTSPRTPRTSCVITSTPGTKPQPARPPTKNQTQQKPKGSPMQMQQAHKQV